MFQMSQKLLRSISVRETLTELMACRIYTNISVTMLTCGCITLSVWFVCQYTPMIISTSIEIMCYVSTVEEFSMKQRISVFSIILVLLKCEADDLFSFIVIGCMCSRRLCLCVVNVCSWQLVQASSTKQYKAVQLMNDEKHSLSLCVVLSSFIRGAKLCMRWMIVLREWSVRGA